MKKSAWKMMWAGLVLAALAMPLASPGDEGAAEAEPEVEASLDASVFNAYVWRGQVLNDETVLQPSLTVSKGGFSVNWWGNLNLTDNVTGDAHEFSEHDIGVSYSHACPLIAGANLTVGIVNYDFPNVAVDETAVGAEALTKNTHEVYLSYALEETPLAPTLLLSYDINEVDALYASLSVTHSVEVNDQVSVEASASVGAAASDYNAFYFGVGDDALNDGSVKLSLSYAMTDDLSLTPSIQYSMLLDSAIEDGAEAIYGEKDYFVGGVTASYSF
jgi:outer membrane scaffolding protein for murein synthesis (MipA/OmpV family)